MGNHTKQRSEGYCRRRRLPTLSGVSVSNLSSISTGRKVNPGDVEKRILDGSARWWKRTRLVGFNGRRAFKGYHGKSMTIVKHRAFRGAGER